MPRLTKGQMAAGIRLRLDLSNGSVGARIVALKDLKSSGGRPPDEVAKFRSFQQLASWEDLERGITPLSIKTLRKHLDALYEGGSRSFRKDMAQLFRPERASEAATVEAGESEKQRADRFSADAAMEMTTRYLDLLERLKRLSVASEAAEAELLRHLRRYSEGGATLRVVKSEP